MPKLINSKLIAVIKYEYLQTIKRKGFWITTLFLPLFFLFILGIQAYSASQSEQIFSKLGNDVKEIHVIDETELVSPEFYQPPVYHKTDLQQSLNLLKQSKIDAVIYFPKNLSETFKYQVYTQDKGLLSSTPFSSLGDSMLQKSVIASVGKVDLQKLLTNKVSSDATYYDKQGKETKIEVSNFILPGMSFIIFFMAVMMASQYLLQSVSEEKENRMIETMLSMINSGTLISGKIIGLSAVVLTQVMIWFSSAIIILLIAVKKLNFNLPFNLADISLAPLPMNIFLTLMGFLLFAAIMVGVGSVATSYRDSQSLSSVFIIMSILPIYFVTFILAEPNGPIAIFTSYFPFTAPMILLIRNSLHTISPLESIFAAIVVMIYVVIAFWLATKMFNLGSLMYNRRPSWKEVWAVIRK